MSLRSILGDIISSADCVFEQPAVYKHLSTFANINVVPETDIVSDYGESVIQSSRLRLFSLHLSVLRSMFGDSFVPVYGDSISLNGQTFIITELDGVVWRYKYCSVDSDRIIVNAVEHKQ